MSDILPPRLRAHPQWTASQTWYYETAVVNTVFAEATPITGVVQGTNTESEYLTSDFTFSTTTTWGAICEFITSSVGFSKVCFNSLTLLSVDWIQTPDRATMQVVYCEKVLWKELNQCKDHNEQNSTGGGGRKDYNCFFTLCHCSLSFVSWYAWREEIKSIKRYWKREVEKQMWEEVEEVIWTHWKVKEQD